MLRKLTHKWYNRFNSELRVTQVKMDEVHRGLVGLKGSYTMKATKRLLWDLQWLSPEPHQKRSSLPPYSVQNSYLQTALQFSLTPLPPWEEGIAGVRLPSRPAESGAMNGGKEALATDCKEMIHTGNRPTQALNQKSAGPPQRQRDQSNPGRRGCQSHLPLVHPPHII